MKYKPREAAEAWRRTWQEAWPRNDVEPIAKLYAPGAMYRAVAFRQPDLDVEGVRRYLLENFAAESAIDCRFGAPIVDGDRAAVEWWASWEEDGRQLTLAGTTVLRFDADGLVVDHRDYWNETETRVSPYEGWDGSA